MDHLSVLVRRRKRPQDVAVTNPSTTKMVPEQKDTKIPQYYKTLGCRLTSHSGGYKMRAQTLSHNRADRASRRHWLRRFGKCLRPWCQASRVRNMLIALSSPLPLIFLSMLSVIVISIHAGDPIRILYRYKPFNSCTFCDTQARYSFCFLCI